MGQPVRILVDSGCTVDLISDKITLPQEMPYVEERMELTTGSGVIKQITKVFEANPVTVQGNSVNCKLKQINLGELPFDIILGTPFLYNYDPIAKWRLGALRFKKFTWFSDKELFNGIDTVNAITVAKDIEKYKRTHHENDEVQMIIVAATMIEDDVDKAISDKLTSSQRDEMKSLIQQFKHRDSIGSEKDNLPHLSEMRKKPSHWHMQIDLDPSVAKEPHSRARPMSPEEMKELKRQLTFLLTHGFIKKSTSRFASPTLFVKKKDGTMRWCCDYRVLNLKTLTPSSPLPRIDQLIDKLTNARYFTALDLIQGYHQLPLHPNDTWKTAITTPYGLFEWTVVPFGLSGAPTHFQNVMSEIFGPMTEFSETVLNLLDDLLIYSEGWDEHIKEVRKVLLRLEKYQFYINFRKCSFGQHELVYVGQRIGRGTRRPDPDKVKALVEHPLPTTATELRSYLGLANYLSQYIPRYSQLIAPFSTHRSLKKATKIMLGKEHRYAMKQLRDAYTREPTLRLPDFKKKFYLPVDASKTSCGSALMQRHEGKLLPVAFHSRLLTKPQKRWPIHDLELYAIVDAMKRFRTYLLDKPFTVLSDHKPLIHLKDQPNINMRQLRYLDYMAMYQFTIEYIPGKDNIFADWLSRPPGDYIKDQDVRPTLEQSTCGLCNQTSLDEVLDDFDVGSGIPRLPQRQVYRHTCNGQQSRGTETAYDPDRGHTKGAWCHDPTKEGAAELATLAVHLSTLQGTEDLDIQQIMDAYAHDDFCKTIMETLETKPGSPLSTKIRDA